MRTLAPGLIAIVLMLLALLLLRCYSQIEHWTSNRSKVIHVTKGVIVCNQHSYALFAESALRDLYNCERLFWRCASVCFCVWAIVYMQTAFKHIWQRGINGFDRIHFFSLLISRVRHISRQHSDAAHYTHIIELNLVATFKKKHSCGKGQHTIKICFNGSAFTQQTHSLLSSSSSSIEFSQFK